MFVLHQPITLSLEAINTIEQLCPSEDLLIFDIETTGFDRIRDHMVSVSILYCLENQYTISQWFSESPEDEKYLLEDIKPYFDNKKIHITYNGHSFDIPFLNIKYSHYNISTSLNKSKCYDLYRFARKALTLESYKLKSIESALNIHRVDQISGLECTLLYQEFLKTKDQALATLILQHNFEDVLNLVDLLPLRSHLNDHQLNEFQVIYLEFAKHTWYISQIKNTETMILINLWGYANQAEQLPSLSVYNHDGTAILLNTVNTHEYLFEFKLPIYKKNISTVEMFCLDLESIESFFSKKFSLEPSDLILKYDGLWHYPSIIRIIETISLSLLKVSG